MEAAVRRIDEALSGAQGLMKQMEDCIGKLADEVNKVSQDKVRQAFEDVEQRVAIVVNEIGETYPTYKDFSLSNDWACRQWLPQPSRQ